MSLNQRKFKGCTNEVFCLEFKVLIGFVDSHSYLKKGMCVCVFRAMSLLENSRMFDQKGEKAVT